MRMSCKKCKWTAKDIDEDRLVDTHHVLPRYMGGTDIDGRIDLCKGHHKDIHNKILDSLCNQSEPQYRNKARTMLSLKDDHKTRRVVESILFNAIHPERKEASRKRTRELTEEWLKDI